MVDYDAAVAAVQDPNADPILLAKIAYENPEFGANVAVNPRCYPGLKRWIAEFGDDRARETLAQYGFTARRQTGSAARGSGGIRGACGHQSLRFHRRTGPDHHRPDANRPDCPVRA